MFMFAQGLYIFQSKLKKISKKCILGSSLITFFYSTYRIEPDGKKYVKYEVIGTNHVAVPTHFYKIVVGENADSLEMEAFVMPNAPIDDNTPLTNFRVRFTKYLTIFVIRKSKL